MILKLIYDKERDKVRMSSQDGRFSGQFPMTFELRQWMNGRTTRFFRARHKGGVLDLLHPVKDRNW